MKENKGLETRILKSQVETLTRAAAFGIFRMQLDADGKIGDPGDENSWIIAPPEMLNLPPGTPVTFASLAAIAGDELQRTYEETNRLIAAGTTDRIVRCISFINSEGTETWLESVITVERDEADNPISLSGTLRDVTEERRARSETRELGELVRNILLQVPVALFRIDFKAGGQQILHYADVSGSWLMNAGPLYGLPEGQLLSPADIPNYVHPEDHHKLSDTFAQAQENGCDSYDVEFRVPLPDGSVRWLASKSLVERDPMGNVIALNGIQYDITESKRQQERIEFMAGHDVLTDLPNRALCMEVLDRTIAAGERHNRPFALMFLDLDDFKKVNDALGHGVGDDVLVATSGRFREALRSSEFIARLGGDEFVVIVEDAADPGTVAQVARRLVETVAKPVELGDRALQVSISIGVSLFPHHGSDRSELLKCADRALYAAKEKGKNNFQIYDGCAPIAAPNCRR